MHEDNNSNDSDGGGRVYSDVTVSEMDYLSKKLAINIVLSSKKI
ncbi:MAG: hypothetical protein O3C01_01530 [Bacteroidetes bacterium]|jgi:hypothetical protein|nr:hypothetical protein [Bacteroidota bacterium]